MSSKAVACPVCGKSFAPQAITSHVNACLNACIPGSPTESTDSRPVKRQRIISSDEAEDDFTSAKKLQKNKAQSPKSGTSQAHAKSSSSQATAKISSSPATANTVTSPVASFFQRRAQGQNKIKSSKPSSPPKTAMVSQSTIFSKPKGSVSKSQASVKVVETEPKPSEPFEHNQDDQTSVKESIASLLSGNIPLAERLRPKTLHDYIGQDDAIGCSTMLHSLLQKNNIPSMIIWGPPGCGKTTLARIVSEKCKQSSHMRFVKLSATTSGIADVKEVIKVAKNEQKLCKRKTTLFVDEIHRFNKLQQDSFLPHIEDGTIVFIGATTENPSFQVNNALLSRCKVVVLDKHSAENVEAIIRRALTMFDITEVDKKDDAENTIDVICIERQAISRLAFLCDGDARIALNGLEVALRAVIAGGNKTDASLSGVVTLEDVKKGLERSHVQYDRAGEEHYNCASALQKSIRGSSADGAIYWLARMMEGGEDPLFIARRLVVCASEDIGLADPHALPLAVATFQACHAIGRPECAINLAHCCTYLARAPKSVESYDAYRTAVQSIKQHEGPLPGVPLHLRNAPTKLMKNLGYGDGYKYSHKYSAEEGKQEYLPQQLAGTTFFNK